MRQLVGATLQGTLVISNADFTNLLLKTGGAFLNAQLPGPRLSTSSLLVTMTATFNMASAPGGIRFRCLIDGLQILRGTAKVLESRVDVTSTGQTSFALSALLPGSILPPATNHIVQPQVYTLEGTATFDADVGFGNFALTVAEVT